MFVSATTTDRNPGIVPPWLTGPATDADRNPGIVPPWLIGDEDTPKILPVDSPNATVQTTFVREPAGASPQIALADAVRGR